MDTSGINAQGWVIGWHLYQHRVGRQCPGQLSPAPDDLAEVNGVRELSVTGAA